MKVTARSLNRDPRNPRIRRSWGLSLCITGLVFSSAFLLYGTENPTPAIKLDQVGYLDGAPKVALVASPAKTFEIRRSSDGRVVFRGALSPAATDPLSGDTVQAADFSGLRQAGTYYVEVPGVGKSWTFAVGANVFERTWYLAMRGFYGQRCGTAVDLGREFPGYSHAACHLHGEFHPSSGKSGPRDNIGGWHDAGDYGRYMVNSGVATGTLLWAWEIYGPRLKPIQLAIPETGNGTPDILNEIRWNLEWMLKMQDTDGGAWHKQTSTHFPGFIAPEKDTLPSEVIGTGSAPYKSTCATADLAAVAAIAARVYRPFDAAFATRALDAARRAWKWTEQYPNVIFRNPPGVTTGEYGDSNCADERLWAAAELWRTTGEAAYNRILPEELCRVSSHPGLSGEGRLEHDGPDGAAALTLLARREGADATAQAAIRDRMSSAARAHRERTPQPIPTTSACSPTDFVWGSNGIAAQYGMDLLDRQRDRADSSVRGRRAATTCTICSAVTPSRSRGSRRSASTRSCTRITGPVDRANNRGHGRD
jgi:endoglucanase